MNRKEAIKTIKEEFGSSDPSKVSVRTKDKAIIVRQGFFYRNGLDSKKFAEQVSVKLSFFDIKHTIIGRGEVFKAFRGGDNTKQGSHFWVAINLVEE